MRLIPPKVVHPVSGLSMDGVSTRRSSNHTDFVCRVVTGLAVHLATILLFTKSLGNIGRFMPSPSRGAWWVGVAVSARRARSAVMASHSSFRPLSSSPFPRQFHLCSGITRDISSCREPAWGFRLPSPGNMRPPVLVLHLSVRPTPWLQPLSCASRWTLSLST